MDEKKIIDLLKKLNSNSKIKYSKISNELNISRKTLQNYIEELKKKKIIENYTININPNIHPNLKYVILEIKTNPKEPHLVDELLRIPQIKMLDGIFGEFSLMAFFIFKDSEEFNQTLNLIDNLMANSYFKKYQIIEIIKIYKSSGIHLSQSKLNSNFEIDETDYLILKILQKRQSIKLISTYKIKEMLKKKHNIEISQSTIYNKIVRLEKLGIILNYSINFNPKKIGFDGKFIIRIKPKDLSKYSEIALKLENKKEISDLFRIGEQFGLLAIVRVKSIEDYASFIKDLYDSGEIEDTFTNFVLDERIFYTNFKLY